MRNWIEFGLFVACCIGALIWIHREIEKDRIFRERCARKAVEFDKRQPPLRPNP